MKHFYNVFRKWKASKFLENLKEFMTCLLMCVETSNIPLHNIILTVTECLISYFTSFLEMLEFIISRMSCSNISSTENIREVFHGY